MTNELLLNILLIIIATTILTIYCIIVIIEERKHYNKITYYKSTLNFECSYDKYFTMIRKMKFVILKKQLYLYYLKVLVTLKGVFKWNKQ